MNTLCFCAGLGVGAFITCFIGFLAINQLAKSNSKNSKQNAEFNRETVELMRERNEIDKQKLAALEQLTRNA